VSKKFSSTGGEIPKKLVHLKQKKNESRSGRQRNGKERRTVTLENSTKQKRVGKEKSPWGGKEHDSKLKKE